jgi:GAF domain-containing protein
VDGQPEELDQALATLSRLLLTEEDLDHALSRVAELAVGTVVACDCCGVSLSGDRGVGTRVATSQIARQVDEEQYAADEGPCLTAVRTGEPVNLQLISATRDQWPAFARAAAAVGVTSSYSVPMTVDHQTVGALNLYSRTGPFQEADRGIAGQLARQAAVTLANVRAYAVSQELVSQLDEALRSRDVIGQAKGILMERHKINADEAFQVLVRASQRGHLKLREVAQRVAETGAEPDHSVRT